MNRNGGTMRTFYSPDVERAERIGNQWRAQAACLDKPYDMFFSSDPRVEAAAKRVCQEDCPVRQACLAYALAAKQDEFGIWGGLTPSERRNMRKRGSAA